MLGTNLPPDVQEEAKRAYTFRHTGQHRPQWMRGAMADTLPAPQFKTDEEWLAHTRFPIVQGSDGAIRLHRGQYKPKPDLAPARHAKAVISPEEREQLTLGPIDPGEAIRLAMRVAAEARVPVWVKTTGPRTGDMTFLAQPAGPTWRKVMPVGEVPSGL